MAIDVKKHKKKFLDQKPNINLVPFIDILFTIMIFLVVTSNFSAMEMQADDATAQDTGTGKPCGTRRIEKIHFGTTSLQSRNDYR